MGRFCLNNADASKGFRPIYITIFPPHFDGQPASKCASFGGLSPLTSWALLEISGRVALCCAAD